MKWNYDRQLQETLVSGSKKAIGWGVSSDIAFKLKQSPYPFEFIIDGTVNSSDMVSKVMGVSVYGRGKLKTLDVNDYVVVVLADVYQFGSEIAMQVKALGDFKITIPFSPWLQKDCEKKINHYVQRYALSRSEVSGVNSNFNSIGMVIYGFTRGGAEWQFYLLAKALLLQGYQVNIFYIEHPEKTTQWWLEDLLALGGKLHNLVDTSPQLTSAEVPPEIAELLTFLSPYEARLVERLSVMLKAEKVNVCISYLLFANVFASLASLVAGVNKVLMCTRCSAPGTIEKDFSEPRLNQVDLKTQRYLMSAMVRFGGVHIAANSQFGAYSYEQWLNLKKGHVSVVRNGLVQAKAHDIQALRKRFSFTDGHFVVLGVMRMVPQKRPFLFVDCIAQLKEKYNKIRAVLVGSGELFAATQTRIEALGLADTIIMVGETSSAEAYMQMADVVLQTSEFEGLPNVVLEAQVAACPVVCSNAGGSAEALAPKLESLCLVKTDGIEEFVSKVANFMHSESVAFYKRNVTEFVKSMSLANLALNTLKAAKVENTGLN